MPTVLPSRSLTDLIFACVFRRDGEGKERQLACRGNALHRRAMCIGLQRDIERGRGVIDRAADQRLHRRRAAAHVDELDLEPFLLEMPVMHREDIRDDAEKLRAEGELHRLAGGAGRIGAEDAGKRGRAFQHGAAAHGDAVPGDGVRIAAAHRIKVAPDNGE